MSGKDQSLLERIELPSIPREAASKMARVQEEFERAEVEQCKYFSHYPVCFIARGEESLFELDSYLSRPSVGARVVLVIEDPQFSLRLTGM